MAGVNRDLEDVIAFCDRFESEYLSIISENSSKLKTIASSVSSTLSGTEFATVASEKLEEAASQLMKAVSTGEERIREIRNNAQQQLEQKQQIESMVR
ncbi:MAG: hypothetical protein LUH07_12710 [Lachnospiraceae bacterium]|nr:hypothetical protein [Lachnospiraceae bacterium]